MRELVVVHSVTTVEAFMHPYVPPSLAFIPHLTPLTKFLHVLKNDSEGNAGRGISIAKIRPPWRILLFIAMIKPLLLFEEEVVVDKVSPTLLSNNVNDLLPSTIRVFAVR